jgi:hypothetical protein
MDGHRRPQDVTEPRLQADSPPSHFIHPAKVPSELVECIGPCTSPKPSLRAEEEERRLFYVRPRLPQPFPVNPSRVIFESGVVSSSGACDPRHPLTHSAAFGYP